MIGPKVNKRGKKERRGKGVGDRMTSSPSSLHGVACTPEYSNPFSYATRAHRHVSIPRMHAHVHARGAPSTNRCPGSSYRAHVREHHGFSLMIFPLFPRVCVTRTPVTNLFLSPSPFASHSRHPSSLFSLAVSVFFLLFSAFPLRFPLLPPLLVIHFIPMEGEGRRGKV